MNQNKNNWVLLRGLTREARHWENLTANLQTQLPDSTIITLDYPGCGLRHQETSPTSMAELLTDLKQQIPKHALPAHFLGISFGGMVAVALADAYPELVQSVTLINSSSRGTGTIFSRLKPVSYLSLLKQFITSNPKQREASIIAMTSVEHQHDKELLARWTSYAKSNPVSRSTAIRQLRIAANFTLPQALNVPVLVLTSQGDTLVDYHCSEKIATQLHGQLAIHPWAGHDLALDDPEWVAEQCKLFWQNIGP